MNLETMECALRRIDLATIGRLRVHIRATSHPQACGGLTVLGVDWLASLSSGWSDGTEARPVPERLCCPSQADTRDAVGQVGPPMAHEPHVAHLALGLWLHGGLARRGPNLRMTHSARQS